MKVTISVCRLVRALQRPHVRHWHAVGLVDAPMGDQGLASCLLKICSKDFSVTFASGDPVHLRLRQPGSVRLHPVLLLREWDGHLPDLQFRRRTASRQPEAQVLFQVATVYKGVNQDSIRLSYNMKLLSMSVNMSEQACRSKIWPYFQTGEGHVPNLFHSGRV